MAIPVWIRQHCFSAHKIGWVLTEFFVLVAVAASQLHNVNSTLDTNFYGILCPNVETLVKDSVSSAVSSDPTIAGSLLRLHFHDCFVQGCDGSVLLDSVDGQQAEKDAIPNLSLRGFDVIDAIKVKVEAACPGVVSCADILAFAARDSVVEMGGLFWQVPAGRRDSLSSLASDANSNLPGSTVPLSTLTQVFQGKGLTESDMVTLSGAHTLGRVACSVITPRLYNFNSTTAQDPSLDATYAQTLKNTCPNGGQSGSVMVDLDLSTPTTFDSMYYQNLRHGMGLLQSDQLMASTPQLRGYVRQFAKNNTLFLSRFGQSMVKMSAIGVLTGSLGEIRLNCRVVNS